MYHSKRRRKSLKRSLDKIRLSIQGFVEQLTEDQYESLSTGCLNNATKIQLAKLLIDALMCTSKTCKKLNSGMMEEEVRGLLGNSFAQMFAAALGVEGAAGVADVESLNALISAEVSEMVRSDESDVSGYMIPPDKLDTIIQQTATMLQTFVAQMRKRGFLPKKHQQIKLEDINGRSAVGGEEPPDDAERREPRSAASPQECLLGPSTPVESVMLEELNGITSPLLQDVPQAQAEVVYLQTSEEMKVVLADLTEHKVKNRRTLKSAMTKLKTFFSKAFAKALIHCKVAELKASRQTAPIEESETSLQMLAEKVDSLLNSLPSEGAGEESECLFSCDDPTFTGLLFNVIHKGVTETEEYETTVETRVDLDPDQGSIEADIRDKMNKFRVLTSWWMNTQLGSCCERVIVTLKHSQKRKKPTLPETFSGQLDVSEDPDVCAEVWQDEKETSKQLKLEREVESTVARAEPETHEDQDLDVGRLLGQKMKEAQQKATRIYIITLVELLVSRLIHKAKFAIEDQNRICQMVTEATFAQLEQCASIELDCRQLQGLRKDIYKDLCRDFGSAENILFLLATNDRLVISCTATLIQYHLTCQRKRGLVRRCLQYILDVFTCSPIKTHLCCCFPCVWER